MAGIIAFALAHLRSILIIAAVAAAAALVIGLKHSYDEGKRNEGRAEVRKKEVDPLKAQIKAAQDRASALALQWDEQRKAADAAGAERDAERQARFDDARKYVAAIPRAIAAQPVPVDVVRVLDASIAAANRPETPGPAAESVAEPARPSPAPEGTVTFGALAEWGQAVAQLYDRCRDTVNGWQAFYANLRASEKGAP